jgi:CxxC motif-containing protein (DUF1111 family)
MIIIIVITAMADRCSSPILCSLCCLLFTGCTAVVIDDAGVPDLIRVREDAPDLPWPGLDDDEMARFRDGDVLFEHLFRTTQGIGPLFIRGSCAACHADDAKGPGFVDKFASDDAPYGTSVRPYTTVDIALPVLAPDGALISRRIGPAVFGRGAMEAVAEDAIVAVAALQASSSGPVKGVVPRVTWHSEPNSDPRFPTYTNGEAGILGRFGLKARVASLDDFAADALQGDMGLTSPMRPTELHNPAAVDDDDVPGVDVPLDTVNLLADYVRLIRIPARRDVSDDGLALLDETGCTACHVRALETRDDYPFAVLAGTTVELFTDMLLHDMGEDLADGLVEEGANSRLWRTAPLMGLRFFRSYLHDGRASSIDEAIRAHASEGSEAEAAVSAYAALTDDERALLTETVLKL